MIYQRKQYPAQTLSGWDDRGLVYVRLGAPSTQRSVRFSAPRLVRMLEKTSAPVRLQDFPENELWAYDEIAEHALYFFVEQDGRYTLASSEELLPRSLRLVSGRRTNVLVQEPPPAKTDVLLEAMRTLYGELAPYHPDFAQAYLDVAAYLDAELPGKTASEPSYRAESEIRRPVHLYAIARLNETHVKEASATAWREEVVPRQRSKVPADPIFEAVAVAEKTQRMPRLCSLRLLYNRGSRSSKRSATTKPSAFRRAKGSRGSYIAPQVRRRSYA